MAVVFVNSLGTGVIVNGIYFLTGFGKVGNYGLGVAMGAMYIVAALTASRTVGWLRRRVAFLSGRAVLVWIMAGVALICVLPAAAGGTGTWAAWVVVTAYGVLTGVLWPLLEAYVGGGRRGRALRSATGQFNIWWAGAIVVAFVAMGPLVRRDPEGILLILGGLHVVGMLPLLAFTPDPARTGEVDHEPHPEVYTRLLRVFRVQLPMSYMVMGALSPYLPVALALLAVPERWRTEMAAIWMLARLVAFATLERWHGWHGRWWVTYVGGVALVAGFAACLLIPGLAPSRSTLVLFGTGLAVFGLGMGMIYTAALYYAMEVGHEEVASGGTHEALIGGGYLTGPLTGLGVAVMVGTGVVAPARFEAVKLGVVCVACLALGAASWLMARRGARTTPAQGT